MGHITNNTIFVGAGSHSHSGFSTAEYFRRLPGRAYPDVHMVKGLFSPDWNIKSISVDIKEYEDIVITVNRILNSSSSDNVFEGLHNELIGHCSGVVMEYQDGTTTVEYKFACPQEFYCERIPVLHKLIYDEQFHKDFEDVGNKQV